MTLGDVIHHLCRMNTIKERRREWCDKVGGGDRGAGYQRVADCCAVKRDVVEHWCLYGFPPARLLQLREIGQAHGAPFDEALIAWPEPPVAPETNGAAA